MSTSFTTVLASSENGFSTQTLIALLAASAGFLIALFNSAVAYIRDKKQEAEMREQARRFEAFKVRQLRLFQIQVGATAARLTSLAG
jgi:hypothetical protein